jgi:hypothetical protein
MHIEAFSEWESHVQWFALRGVPFTFPEMVAKFMQI